MKKKSLKDIGYSRTVESMSWETEWTLVHSDENEVLEVSPDLWDIANRAHADWKPSKLKILWYKFCSLFIRKSKYRGKSLKK